MNKDNPFTDRAALQNSNYIHPQNKTNGESKNVGTPDLTEAVHEELRDFILHKKFPCLAAKASFNTDSYRLGVYNQLGQPQSTQGLSRDLLQFIEERKSLENNYTSFLAVFTSEAPETEKDFEQLLWQQLQQLHRQSSRYFDWDKSVSSNPEDDNFSFSFGGKAFYVVGMHPNASRMARRFSHPMLVFNPHEQFEELKQNGTYGKMQKKIRKRDKQLQGSVNPMLQNFGEGSEARQYSGRKVSENWKCPFHS